MLIRTIVWLLVFLLPMGQHPTLLASDYFGEITFNRPPGCWHSLPETWFKLKNTQQIS